MPTSMLTESLIVPEEMKDEPVMKPFCPYCGTVRSGRRSRLKWFDLPLLFLYVRPVRCTDCYGRYYRFINGSAAKRAVAAAAAAKNAKSSLEHVQQS